LIIAKTDLYRGIPVAKNKPKQAISSASARLKSRVYVHALSPQDVKTCGIGLTKEQAIELATCILAVAQASNAEGLIYATGHSSQKAVTVLRKLN
jgi:hypothetical protein